MTNPHPDSSSTAGIETKVAGEKVTDHSMEQLVQKMQTPESRAACASILSLSGRDMRLLLKRQAEKKQE